MTTPITATPAPSPEALKASYGFVGQLANSVPEIKTILDQAVREQWTSDRFIMAVSGTNWYRTNQNYARELITLQATDPATAAANKYRTYIETSLVAEELGLHLSNAQLNDVAFLKQTNPTMSDEYLRAHLVRNYFNPNQDWSKLTGTAGELAGQIEEYAQAYGYGSQLNTDSGKQWLMKLMDGTESVDAYKHAMVEFAKVKYPGLAMQLESGMTVKQLADPYLQSYSKILEVPQTAINWNDDKLISQALQTQGAAGNSGGGKQTAGAMPIYDFEKTLREDPRWRKTDNAKDSVATMINTIGKDWGYIGR